MRNEINMKTVCSLVGVEENKNYLDVNRSDDLYEGQQLVRREGPTVRVLVAEDGCIMDLSFGEAYVLGTKILKAAEDAKKIERLIAQKAKEHRLADIAHPVYDPNEWNRFPEVEPPEDILMRVETKTGQRICAYWHKYAEGGCWVYAGGPIMPEALSKTVERYRPWD